MYGLKARTPQVNNYTKYTGSNAGIVFKYVSTCFLQRFDRYFKIMLK